MYYKDGSAVLAAFEPVEWKGCAMVVLRRASDNTWSPLGLVAMTPDQLAKLEPATLDDWTKALAIAERHQAELDKAAAKKAEGERYGVAVTRHKRSYFKSEDQPITPDVIVRCTKTRWVGLLGSYKRTVNLGSPGEMLSDASTRYTSSAYLDDSSLDHLAKMARGRLVVDFIKEAKAKEDAKAFKLRGESK